MPRLSLAVLAFSLPLVACGSKDDAPAAGAAADPGRDLTTIVTGGWTIEPGTEGYVCVRKTLTEDLVVGGFEALNPPGTHHTLLTYGDPDGPDGITDCNAAEIRPRALFASGVGTDPLDFPEGVGFRIAKGTQLLLNLHLFNTSDEPLSGESGTRARVLSPADVVHEAEGLLAGTTSLEIPAGATTDHVGHCTMTSDVTLFAVAPHMHQLGIHEKVVAESAGKGEVVLHDAPYSFEEQSFSLIDPLELKKGERLRIECRHRNTTDSDVRFGDSSLAEMCFAGVYRYPADGTPFICVDRDGAAAGPALMGPPCAAAGATGNELGVGKFCSAKGLECAGGAPYCIADFATGTWGNFCTNTCQADADCGSGAVCSPAREGSSIRTCVPEACVDTVVPG